MDGPMYSFQQRTASCGVSCTPPAMAAVVYDDDAFWPHDVPTQYEPHPWPTHDAAALSPSAYFPHGRLAFRWLSQYAAHKLPTHDVPHDGELQYDAQDVPVHPLPQLVPEQLYAHEAPEHVEPQKAPLQFLAQDSNQHSSPHELPTQFSAQLSPSHL